MREKGRAAIYAMAGIYLLVMAYYMFRDRANSAGGEFVVIMIFMCLFAVIGAGLIIFSIIMMNRARKKDIERAKEAKKELEKQETEKEETEKQEEMEEKPDEE